MIYNTIKFIFLHIVSVVFCNGDLGNIDLKCYKISESEIREWYDNYKWKIEQ